MGKTGRKTILVVGAHMDDCEIGAGGLIIKAKRKGHRVVLVNVASDYSTWHITKGRERQIRTQIVQKANEMGVEKRFLDYGYQSVPLDLKAARHIARIILEVRPDITLCHNNLDLSPADHRTVGLLTEYAIRQANTILGGKDVRYSDEMYAYEVMPVPGFQPDTFIDISDVIKETAELPGYFDQMYAESPYLKGNSLFSGRLEIDGLKQKILLYKHGELKLATAVLRGLQCGARFAEAYLALNQKIIGKRILQDVI